MKKIILFCSLGLISFSSKCFAMHAQHNHPIDEEKLSRHLRKLFLDTHHLRLESETESSQESQRSEEDFTPASSWQDDSLMDPQPEKENIPPSQHKKGETHMDSVAKLVDDFLGTDQDTPKNPGLKRSKAFLITR